MEEDSSTTSCLNSICTTFNGEYENKRFEIHIIIISVFHTTSIDKNTALQRQREEALEEHEVSPPFIKTKAPVMMIAASMASMMSINQRFQ